MIPICMSFIELEETQKYLKEVKKISDKIMIISKAKLMNQQINCIVNFVTAQILRIKLLTHLSVLLNLRKKKH